MLGAPYLWIGELPPQPFTNPPVWRASLSHGGGGLCDEQVLGQNLLSDQKKVPKFFRLRRAKKKVEKKFACGGPFFGPFLVFWNSERWHLRPPQAKFFWVFGSHKTFFFCSEKIFEKKVLFFWTKKCQKKVPIKRVCFFGVFPEQKNEQRIPYVYAKCILAKRSKKNRKYFRLRRKFSSQPLAGRQ